MTKSDYEYNDIIFSLRKIGLEQGDSVFIHSNLGFFGKLKDANDSNDYNRFFKKDWSDKSLWIPFIFNNSEFIEYFPLLYYLIYFHYVNLITQI